MKKYQIDFKIEANTPLSPSLHLLDLNPVDSALPELLPGQFVNILPPKSSGKLLRRPISVCDVKESRLRLMIKRAGAGTDAICDLCEGDSLNIVLPLGNGFTVPEDKNTRILLVGGGVGIAPLLYYGRCLADNGIVPRFLLGGRSESDIPMLTEFSDLGDVFITTEDGSAGTKGFVTDHSIISDCYDLICCCGPSPMMKAVGKVATASGTKCEVSLENMMACGIGACLCCVQETVEHHNECVCTKGPVFDFMKIKW